MKKKGVGAKWLIVIVFVLIALFFALIGFITDYLWFKELNYVSVFFTKLFTQLKIGIPLFIVVALTAYVYTRVLRKGYYKKIQSQEIPNEKVLKRIGIGLSSVAGLVVSFMVSNGLWFKILEFANSTDFNIKDPLFKMDISFYIFKLDFITELNQIIIGIVVLFAILTVVYYLILLSMRTPQMFDEQGAEENAEEYDTGSDSGANAGYNPFEGTPFGEAFGKFGKAMGGGAPKQHKAKKQFDDRNFMQLVSIATRELISLGVIFFLMLAVNFFLKQYELLYSPMGAVYGAGFTDVNVTLWVYRALIVLSVIGAVTFVIGILKRKFKMILTVPVIMIAVGLVGTGAAAFVQNLVVSPDEINKESQYLERNIKYTQYAYGLDNVDTKEFTANNSLTKEDIENNKETIKNIRINDFEPTAKFYNQTQSIRQYYNFHDVDVDRYMINGEYTQTFLSAREIDESKIQQEWLNTHLKYTHGYGITLSRVDKVTPSGQPDMLIDSIPPVSDVEEIDIKRPEIYFGEMTKNYVLVGTSEKEFDYPNGNSNEYAMYDGDAGIKLNMFNRIMFSLREQSLKLLVSTNLDGDSKIIINRDIKDRVKKIMPYLSYDEDPYIVTVDGKLYWMMDAYTTSSNYPYSEPYSAESSVNYVRNSVKIVIDAYNGTTNFYLVDNSDPIANTMKKIFPDLFKDFSEMPEQLQAHVRYPNTLFTIQANVYKRYHMEDVNVFYQGEDLWDISKEIYGTKEIVMTPNYYIMKLPGETSAEFVNTIPYTPRDKQNMMGLLVARNDGEHYGEMVLYQLPKSKIVYGPMQIEAQIDQSTEISKEFSLWNSSGSTYTRGNMFVIPIEDSLIYVEPVYLEATNSSIPEVKRVIVAYNDKIAYEATLGEALSSLFGTENSPQTTTSPTGDGTTVEYSDTELAKLANEAFANAQNAQQSGDWAKYGEYLNQLQKYLNMLAE